MFFVACWLLLQEGSTEMEYHHELVDEEDSDDENEVIDREEWAELALVVLYLNKAEARDKVCRAIQYGSKFLSNGLPGMAHNVDKSTSLARKVFCLFKLVNDLHGLISPVPQGIPLPHVLLGKNAILSTFLFLDQIVWLGRSGFYKNRERAELLVSSLYCKSGCQTLG
ncbi:hypothetical protein Ddye_026980 [Dipteronia dyeriana]|uniref:Uncharacterized protein n=1 Tax=Dipteronia dyeriana TaxID=168575 RepID=A0AAD9TN96_9ROSI|nr:hypothetical protein Ddye_026980 [Dipteronia dyeriana]